MNMLLEKDSHTGLTSRVKFFSCTSSERSEVSPVMNQELLSCVGFDLKACPPD